MLRCVDDFPPEPTPRATQIAHSRTRTHTVNRVLVAVNCVSRTPCCCNENFFLSVRCRWYSTYSNRQGLLSQGPRVPLRRHRRPTLQHHRRRPRPLFLLHAACPAPPFAIASTVVAAAVIGECERGCRCRWSGRWQTCGVKSGARVSGRVGLEDGEVWLQQKGGTAPGKVSGYSFALHGAKIFPHSFQALSPTRAVLRLLSGGRGVGCV